MSDELFDEAEEEPRDRERRLLREEKERLAHETEQVIPVAALPVAVDPEALPKLLASEDVLGAIDMAMKNEHILDSIASCPLGELEAAFAELEKRPEVKVKDVSRLERVVRARRKELLKAAGEAQEEADPATVEDTLREIAGQWDSEEAKVHDLAAVLNMVVAILRTYVWFPRREQAHAVALWIVHTFCIKAAWTSPRLSIRGPSMRCGKTRLLEVLEVLVFEPLSTINMTPAVLFRLVGASPRTVLLDEVDTIFGPKAGGNEELRGLIDAGQRRGGKVYRLEGDTAKGFHAVELPVFGTVALTGIGRLPGTIEDRSIIIELARKQRRNKVLRFRADRAARRCEEARMRLAAWALRHVDDLTDADPELPEELSDRAQDGWEPLLAIADAAGGKWPERARAAAKALMARDAVDDSDPLVLLGDIRASFEARGWPETVFTTELITDLTGMEEAPWAAFRKGAGVTPRDLAKMLKDFNVEPAPLWQGARQRRGYRRSAFADAWLRYLDPVTVDITDRGDETCAKTKQASDDEIIRTSVTTAGQGTNSSVMENGSRDGKKVPLTSTCDGCTDKTDEKAPDLFGDTIDLTDGEDK